MDKDLLIENIQRFARANKESPSHACIAAGVGKSFISDLRRDKIPSVAKVSDLAAYLGISTSDLVGDVRGLPAPLLSAWDQLNDEGRAKLLDYADDLAQSGKYIKNRPAELDQADEIKGAGA